MELDGMMAEAGAEVAPEAGASEAGAATTPSTSWTLTWDVSSIYPQGPGHLEDGFLPYMATQSRGFVSSLLASSYAERVNSAAKLILTKGNTLLAEEEINMCTVLRMNRRFMEFMRKYHPEAANQRFKMTVVSEDFLGSSD